MWGRKAKPCRVLYVAGEGESGFAARLLVLRAALGDAGEAFQYIAQPAVMGPPSGDLSYVIAAARAMRANLVVIDTLARTFGEGDENAARDMSGYIAACDQLRTETRAHVAVVHHGTKEGATARGSGALLGAVDLSVRVSKGGEGGAAIALVECSKDDASGAEMPFRLRVVELAPDADGDPRTTCRAEAGEAGAKPRKTLPQVARSALTTLATLILSEGEPIPPGELMPLHAKGVRDERWRSECEARRLSLAESQKDRDRVFRQAVQALRGAGEIALRDGWVWLLRTPSSADDGCEIP